MQKFITDIKSLATLLMAGAALAACSGDDNIVEELPAPPAQHTYTMTIEATKGGDAGEPAAANSDTATGLAFINLAQAVVTVVNRRNADLPKTKIVGVK